MVDSRSVLLLAGPPQGGEANPAFGFLLWGAILGIFYFIWLRPMTQKQRKIENLVKSLKAGDKIIITPGIFGTVVAVEDDCLHVRIADQTKIRVLKSAVSGLQGQKSETEK